MTAPRVRPARPRTATGLTSARFAGRYGAGSTTRLVGHGVARPVAKNRATTLSRAAAEVVLDHRVPDRRELEQAAHAACGGHPARILERRAQIIAAREDEHRYVRVRSRRGRRSRRRRPALAEAEQPRVRHGRDAERREAGGIEAGEHARSRGRRRGRIPGQLVLDAVGRDQPRQVGLDHQAGTRRPVRLGLGVAAPHHRAPATRSRPATRRAASAEDHCPGAFSPDRPHPRSGRALQLGVEGTHSQRLFPQALGGARERRHRVTDGAPAGARADAAQHARVSAQRSRG